MNKQTDKPIQSAINDSDFIIQDSGLGDVGLIITVPTKKKAEELKKQFLQDRELKTDLEHYKFMLDTADEDRDMMEISEDLTQIIDGTFFENALNNPSGEELLDDK